MVAIGFWFLLQLVSALFGGDEAVGWFAHLGGFVSGAILILVMRRRYDPVLARDEAAGTAAGRSAPILARRVDKPEWPSLRSCLRSTLRQVGFEPAVQPLPAPFL